MKVSENKSKEKALLIGLNLKRQDKWIAQDQLSELAQLARTAGAEVAHTILQRREKIDPAYYIGKGKCQEIKALVSELGIDMVIFDDDLLPAQERNIESVLKTRIIDRTGLILDIFARRAHTSESMIEVELAQLNYLLPRLTGHWRHLSRQVGGIGVRGPGETQLESDRRLLRNRIDVLRRKLDRIEQGRETRRKKRSVLPLVALVGYTNAGKSTLLNAMTGADVFVEDQLFATLDPAIRGYKDTEGRKIIVTDTVGFIRKLPHHLIASFRSTLEEVVYADLLLHVVDVSHPQLIEQMNSVHEVLKTLQADKKPLLTVFNKVDVLERDTVMDLVRERFKEALFISAVRKIGLDALKGKISQILFSPRIKCKVSLEPAQASRFEERFDNLEIESRKFVDNKVEIRFITDERHKDNLKEFSGIEEIEFD